MSTQQEKKISTLCIVHQGDQVLLGMKKRGFGEGRWNGFGGKVREGESIEKAMQRELQEEAGITPSSFSKKALFEFHFKGNPVYLEVHVFYIPSFEGSPVETEEMKPQWFSVGEIPFKEMWPDDKYWLPLFLEGKSLKGQFFFEDQNTILNHTLEIAS
jgi:8-oxo-dGTP diphosphatase / 2-hydroxy-dATP diphosphatase